MAHLALRTIKKSLGKELGSPEREIWRGGLELTNHNIEIKYEDIYYHGKATDEKGNVFEGGGPDLLCCLYKMIYKICKESKGTVKSECIPILEIKD